MRTWQLEVINEDEKVDQKEDTPGNFKRAQFQYQWIKKSPWDTSMQLLIIFATSAFFFLSYCCTSQTRRGGCPIC